MDACTDEIKTLLGNNLYPRVMTVADNSRHHKELYQNWSLYCRSRSLGHSECSRSMTVNVLKYLGLVATKPVFGVSDKAKFKPVSSATGTS